MASSISLYMMFSRCLFVVNPTCYSYIHVGGLDLYVLLQRVDETTRLNFTIVLLNYCKVHHESLLAIGPLYNLRPIYTQDGEMVRFSAVHLHRVAKD